MSDENRVSELGLLLELNPKLDFQNVRTNPY
jgi:hypothetical protein